MYYLTLIKWIHKILRKRWQGTTCILCWHWIFTNKTPIFTNNPEESYIETKAIHEACGYVLNLVTLYDSNKNTYTNYRGKDCIQKLCEELKTQATEIINYEKKKMIPITNN